MKKRSRFYQSMLDTPLLKSGRETLYKNLPSTVIIFITQEDIFGRDLAKYTFTERCKEVEDLELEDGTTKIFFNMTSKNGSKELISLLQYMKDTRIENPEIIVKDERITELDHIVQEVKESEEWEAVKMNILEIGIQQGLQKGLQQGMQQGMQQGLLTGARQKLTVQVQKKLEKGYSVSQIAEMLEEPAETIEEIVEELKNKVIS